MDEGSATCFHTRSLHLLSWLEQKAQGEVWTKVLLIVGKRLPAELADRVYEAALPADCVSMNPGTGESQWYGPPDERDPDQPSKRVFRTREEQPPKRFPRTRGKYAIQCRNLKEPPPGDLDYWLNLDDTRM